MKTQYILPGLVRRNRSVRRFVEDEILSLDMLEGLVDCAALCGSAANRQPLRYALVTGQARNGVFDCLAWAAYLKGWKGPAEGERPGGYVVVLSDESQDEFAQVDAGLAMQTMLLAAVEQGYNGCMLGSVNRTKLAEVLDLPEGIRIVYVLALGKAAEEVVLEELAPGGDIKYWRDDKDVHHVPKRKTADIILKRLS